MHASIAERFAYGTPLEPVAEDTRIHTVPRAGTALLGRLLISAIFLSGGIAKLTDPATTAAYMESAGIPSAGTLVYVAGFAELLGAVSVLFGLLTRVGALGLALYLIPTTYYFHDFWTLTGAEAQAQLGQFMKNLAIIGGLLALVAFGASRYSIDSVIRRPIQA